MDLSSPGTRQIIAFSFSAFDVQYTASRFTKEKQMKDSTNDRVKGKLHETKGKIKEKVGRLTDNPGLQADGQDEKFAGKIQKTIGKVEKVLEK